MRSRRPGPIPGSDQALWAPPRSGIGLDPWSGYLDADAGDAGHLANLISIHQERVPGLGRPGQDTSGARQPVTAGRAGMGTTAALRRSPLAYGGGTGRLVCARRFALRGMRSRGDLVQ
ncbi:MAG TPA: hypothetical protein VNI34_09265 [Candidatus Nitrosotalea sp.]|nr:hypothetical protein [Candidatus Nitrosotalea sp.]